MDSLKDWIEDPEGADFKRFRQMSIGQFKDEIDSEEDNEESRLSKKQKQKRKAVEVE